MSQHDDRVFEIAVGRRHRGRARNVRWSWGQLVEKLSVAEVGREALDEYLDLDKDEQLALKNVGFFVAGRCRDGIRRKENVEHRSMVCLDFDDVPETLLADLTEGRGRLAGFEYLLHSTRKHRRPEAIRFRVVVPLAETIPAEQYEPLARMVASWIDPAMAHADKVSFRAAQYMFWPSRCRDGEFLFHRNTGGLLDPETVLLEYLDWEDPLEWPKREDEHLHGNVNADVRREDPRERLNAPVVAAFCRAYDVHEAIASFLPELYEEATGHGDERYTYVPGSSAAGARVYDDGLYLHSEHDTDPAHGQHNAFDLVRIHLYGTRDRDVDATVTPLSNWPSYKAMQALSEKDAAVKTALAEVKQEAYEARLASVMGEFEVLDDEDEPVGDDDILAELDDLPRPEKAKVRSPEVMVGVLLERMESAETLKDLRKVVDTVSGLAVADFPHLYRDQLVTEYMRQARTITEGKFAPTRAEAKKHLRPTEEASREALRRDGVPEWLDGYCVLTGEDRFLNLVTGERMTVLGFNAKFDAICAETYPSEKTGLPAIRPAEAATALFDIPKPYKEQYWPGRGRLYELEGVEYANTYRDTGARPDGNDDRLGVKLLEIHFENLFPDTRDRALVLDWFTHIVQNPDRKLMYALLMKGVRGDGKTFFSEMMKACLGLSNCSEVQSNMLGQRFNPWAAGVVFVVVEEVKQHGAHSFDVQNDLKPVITNRFIAVERKGQDVVTLPNFANLFMTTNYDDAMPFDDEENRYLAVRTRFNTTDERKAWEDAWEAEHGYPFFETLYRELHERPWQFREFLDLRQPSHYYNPSARAPRTRHLERMVEDAKPGERQLVEDVLGRDEEPLLTERIFCWWRFEEILDQEIPGHRMRGRAVSSMMHVMGYMRAGRERIGGKLRWVWTRDPEMVGDGTPLSRAGKDALEKALEAQAGREEDDFQRGNVVPIHR